MAANATPGDFFKTSTTPGTPVVLGASSVKFNSVQIHGYKAAGTANTSDVKVRPVGGSGWIIISSESSYNFPVPNGCHLDASQFEIDVSTSGDGVYVTYSTNDAEHIYDGA